jgi:peptidoglycan/LPS O-acetylase OafA/YrhL
VARVSYGTYLIHPFVLFWVLTRVRTHLGLEEIHAWSLGGIFALVLGLSLVIASLMFVLVERPLLDLGHRLGRPADRGGAE